MCIKCIITGEGNSYFRVTFDLEQEHPLERNFASLTCRNEGESQSVFYPGYQVMRRDRFAPPLWLECCSLAILPDETHLGGSEVVSGGGLLKL